MSPRRPSALLAIAVLVALITGGCSSSSGKGRVSSSTGKSKGKRGSGCHDLIPIRSTKTTDGIAAQARWLREHYGDYRKRTQELIFCDNGKQADRVEIELPDGRVVEVYFDISRFFGKY